MRRREFIILVAGAAAAWPLAARAQQPDRLRRISVLMGYAESDSEGQAFIAALRDVLNDPDCTHGADCLVHPAARRLHNFDC